MRTPPPLDTYRRKRDPARTPEPMGARRRGRRATPRFVIQKHQARRLHYDLRLEADGVLKSWAVPRGPSVDPAVKRLAVQTEDHPLDYEQFEGVIPPGNYGAGAMIVWDHGTYQAVGSGTAASQIAKGHVELELAGRKLGGRWTLIRTHGDGRNEDRSWLLVKKPDPYALGPEPVETRPESVLSQRPLEAVAGAPVPSTGLAERIRSLRLPRAPRAAARLALMLPTLVEEVPRGPGWVFEVKWDGVRVLIVRRDGVVTLLSRQHADVTPRYPEVAAAAARLGGDDLVLDAEIVAPDREGRPSFHRLQRRVHATRNVAAVAAETPVLCYAFDCLAVHDRDTRGLPLDTRKEILAALAPTTGTLRYAEHLTGDGAAILESTRELGLEGLVAKRIEAPYRGGRRAEWQKIKCQHVQEFVIGGYTEPKGGRAHLGALHLGVYTPGGLTYAGRVGSGLDTDGLAMLARRLTPLARPRSPFRVGSPADDPQHHWVEPRLVCQVRFTEWTPEGHLRHPVFLGLRRDVPPRAVRREDPVRPHGAPRRTPARARGSAPPRHRRRPRSGD